MGIFDKLKKKKSYLYTEDALDRFEAFVAEHFGPYSKVFHEKVSEDIHVDVIVVPPTGETPYYTLVTMGMGAYPMAVPENIKPYEAERAELVFFLPDDWPLASNRREDLWPLLSLIKMARYPMQQNTWLGAGHTVPLPVDETDFGGLMLLDIANLEENFPELRLPGFGRINFYALMPLYREELAYKRQHGFDTFLALFGDDGLPLAPENGRKNYAL